MSEDLFRLDGKIVVLTGGFGQLGQQFTVALHQQGAQVVILDKNIKPEIRDEAFMSLVDAGKVSAIQIDIRSKDSIGTAYQKIAKEQDVPHVLINAAALDTPPSGADEMNASFEGYSPDLLSDVIDINLKGLFFCCQVFGAGMAEKQRGSIINIGSIYGMVSPNQDIYAYKRTDGQSWFKPAPYAMTKSGVYNLTRYLATYWARHGVRVNTITPGGIFKDQDEPFLIEYRKRVPIGRMAHPHEINGAVIFLASEASSYVTGSNLVVDGGYTAW
ncbi:SDR family oxidoreductase [Omnitrophica bacterium]|nr:SDR family oxidoreductase [Candidatus Omnitrophota bacterium]